MSAIAPEVLSGRPVSLPLTDLLHDPIGHAVIRCGLLTGAPLKALIETADIMPFRPDRAFVRGLRLDTDADDWRIAVGGRETLKRADQVAYKPETAPTVERFAPCRVSARYHRARIRIPAGTDWTYAVGVEPDATREGRR